MTYPHQNFYCHDGSFTSSPTPPPSDNFHIQPTTTTQFVSPTTFWCYHCHTPNHPPEECLSIGCSLGLGQPQFNSFQGPTSDPYTPNFNAKCWNHQKISLDQSIQNLQSNWPFNNPSLPSCELKNNFKKTQIANHELPPEFTSKLEALQNRVAQSQNHSEAIQQSNFDNQSNWHVTEPSPSLFGFYSEPIVHDTRIPIEESCKILKELKNEMQTFLQEQQTLSLQLNDQHQFLDQALDCVDKYIGNNVCERKEIETGLTQLVPEQIIPNQTHESPHDNQVNQFCTLQDSIFQCYTIFESSSSSNHLTPFEEFEQQEQVDEEQEEDEIMHDLKFLLQIFAMLATEKASLIPNL